MARIRTIKPSFFKSDDVSALPLRARLTWIGLWTQCDDQGRTKDHTRLIKADIWPLDTVSLADIEEDLSTLAAHGRIVRYEVDGKRYLEVTNWSEHQKIDRPSKSTIPPPTNGHRALVEDSTSTRAGKGKEGRGREGTRDASAHEADGEAMSEPPDSEPPSRCQKHLNSRNPPSCGPCADARREHNRWQKAYNERIADSPKCRVHRGEMAHNCRLCRAEELAPA
jgi:hypothetical protein